MGVCTWHCVPFSRMLRVHCHSLFASCVAGDQATMVDTVQQEVLYSVRLCACQYDAVISCFRGQLSVLFTSSASVDLSMVGDAEPQGVQISTCLCICQFTATNGKVRGHSFDMSPGRVACDPIMLPRAVM